jgi:hypothetical protein
MEGRDEKGRFAKGNLFSLGNTGGRPPKYDDPAVMEKKIAEYLDWEDSQKDPILTLVRVKVSIL